MPTQVQFRRGNTAQTAIFTGAQGEITIDVENNALIVHDGTTMGGWPVLNLNSPQSIGGDLIPDITLTHDLGSDAYRWKDLYLSGNTLNLGGASIKTDATTGAIALIPTPTVSNPDPVALVVSSTGAISTANTSGGVLQSNDFADAANNAATLGLAEEALALAQAAFSFSNGINSFSGTSTLTDGSYSLVLDGDGIVNIPTSSSGQAVIQADNVGISIPNDVTVTGNLTVTGATHYTDVNQLLVENNSVILNSSVTGTPALDASIVINRGNQSNTALKWNESNKNWTFTNDGSTYKVIADAANVTTAINNAASASAYANTGINNAASASSYANTGITLAQAAFDKANTDLTLETAGFDAANSASLYANTGINNAASASSYANTGINNAASASSYANTGINNAASASLFANTGINDALTAINNAASASSYANTGINNAASASLYANTGINNAASASLYANTGINNAASASSYANTGINNAASASSYANSGITLAQAAFNATNSASSYANTGINNAASASLYANTGINNAASSSSYANTGINNAASASSYANSGITLAQAAFNQGNSTATVANSKFSSSGGSITGSVSISNDLTVSGNLTITGNSTTISSASIEVTDPLIYLGINNYTSDILTIGIAGHYNNGTNAHTGIIRDASSKDWYIFQGYVPELDSNNVVNIADASFQTANLNVSYLKGSNVIANGVNLGTYVQTAYSQANTATNNAASASSYANTGINNAASASSYANTGINNAASASSYANTGINNAASASSYANSGITLAQAAYGRANTSSNTFNGTTGSAAPTASGVVTFTSGNGITVSGSGSTLTISSSQDLQSNASPTFASISIAQSGSTLGYRTSNTYTTSSTAQVAVDSFSATTYRSAKYIVQLTSSTSYHVIELLVVHNGTTPSLVQYAEAFTGSSLGTFDASITTGVLNLLCTPTNGVTTVRVLRDTMNV